jgi:cation/acetate symporter
MIPDINWLAAGVFVVIVLVTVGLSFYLGSRAKSAKGYFAAGGGIHWFVNGVAFAGDYLSAASFLGICGMIAFYGYDGFLYSIGYLAGWVVALFVVAEPLKRMGKYTFADALDSRFQSRGIQLAAGLSTLAVSIFYLIPQMVGAGTLVQPLFNLQHAQGVSIVGAVVIVIVVTAGMVSTTYVQFLKGGLLILFSLILTVMILYRGLSVGANTPDGKPLMTEQSVSVTSSGEKLINGLPQGNGPGKTELPNVGHVASLPNGQTSTGPIGPIRFLATVQQSEFVLWRKSPPTVDDDGTKTEIYKPKIVAGKDVLSPGNLPAFAGIRSDKIYDKLNFLSLMLALFGGTASLPHILIRYYTVRDQSSARKSTIVGISTIGLFYVLTLFMGLGAMASGSLDMTNSNMAAPLLARSFSEWLFAIISAIAFTTVLGTVSGLIIAASGAIVHDLTVNVARIPLTDNQQVRLAKISSVGIGVIAIGLGIVFGKMNVSYLVGWAFSVAASANLPALIMLLFWRGTTRQGITAAIIVGMVSSLAWVLLSADTFKDIYGLPPEQAWVPFSQPGLVTIPLGFVTLIVVSLMTPQGRANKVLAEAK